MSIIYIFNLNLCNNYVNLNMRKIETYHLS